MIPGELAHIDYSKGLSKDVYMKSFVDYFMLSFSKKNYLVVDNYLYESDFPYRASLHQSVFQIYRP